ncbi:activatory protein Cha4p [[Candida] jaroonii]|uniref:Activatory protein Cha4p n=1 Tax=[Candida] jaroonii TaxID=467808 RepID=A0ACA9YFP2_9ASCO|nr:activatory protein Cha4p [[Candida] jaroonii]
MPRMVGAKRTSLSCTTCRVRKRKCDGQQPCSTCIAKNTECEYTDVDRRRQRPTTSYIEGLEKTNTMNEKMIETLKEEHSRFLDVLKTNINDYQRLKSIIMGDVKEGSVSSSGESDAFNHLVVSGKSGTASMVLGPTSIYNDDLIIDRNLATVNTPAVPVVQYNLTIDQMNELNDYRRKYGYEDYRLFYFKEQPLKANVAIFRECISLFFKWMYSSSFLFIHRESFLYFYLSNEIDCEFVTIELIYAISALGARISGDSFIRSQADEYYKLAKQRLFTNGDEKYFIRESSICKLQTLLCLAFYDLGRGELASGWLLSGLAFRMGHDIGFELDPQDWNVSPPLPKRSNSDINSANATYTSSGLIVKSTREDVYRNYPFEIGKLRSRIYWGSFVAERLICLVMGRSPTLKLTDVTIPDSQDIGDLTGIEDFIFYDNASDRQYACRAFYCLRAVVALLILSDDILNKVFGSATNGVKRSEILTSYNLKLLKWKESLGKELFWNKSILKKTAHNELYMGPRYTYFIIMLSINRPFISMAALGSKNINLDVIKMPLEICDDVIDDLEIVIKALLYQQETYQSFCPHILSVYAIVLSISVLLWRFKISEDIKFKTNISTKINFFFNFLEKCSEIWTLANKPVEIFRMRINDLWEEPETDTPSVYEQDLQLSQEFNNENIYDAFSRQDLLKGFDMADFSNIDDVFQSVFERPSNQQMLTRLDLADALWDKSLYDKKTVNQL